MNGKKRTVNRVLGLWVFAAVLTPGPVADRAFAVDLQPKMGAPLSGLTPAQLDRFIEGQTKFNTALTIAEGLGPVFNETSCGACHSTPIGGSGAMVVTRFGFFDDKNEIFDPLDEKGGSLLQVQGINGTCIEVVPPEANVTAHRLTTSTLGFGLIEAIPDADIQANEAVGPGISGKAHMVEAFEDPPLSPLRVGRFGWKSQVATVLTFSADASLNEMGLTNRFILTENDPNGDDPPTLGECDTVADPEDGPDINGQHFIDHVTHFQRFLAAPPQTPKSGMTGESIFNAIGCDDCHIPLFMTSNDGGLEDAIRNKPVRAYSDFLLHDMGTLGDGIEQGMASVRELRTTPLWGLRMRDPLIHDARVTGGTFASRVTAAIGWHNAPFSEAQPAGAAFAALSQTDKDHVIAFLGSLGRAEFDADGNNFIDQVDFADFVACFTGPTPTYTPDDACSVHDIDQDGDVDNDDYALFLQAYEPVQGDCNSNTVNDLTDILNATSLDCNTNAVPDECDSQYTDIALFVAVMLGTNQDPALLCMYDRNADSEVNGLDVQPFIDFILP